MLSARTTDLGVRLVTITVFRRIKLPIVVDPSRVIVHYLYGRPHVLPAHPRLAHAIAWEVFGLMPGEMAVIHLKRTRGIKDPRLAQLMLREIFPNAHRVTGGYGWEIRHPDTMAETGYASSPAGNIGAFGIKYDVALYRGGKRVAGLDPDIHLVPDP